MHTINTVRIREPVNNQLIVGGFDHLRASKGLEPLVSQY